MKKNTVILEIIIGIVLAVCIVLAVIGVKSVLDHMRELAREHEETMIKMGQESFQWQLEQVRAGKQNYLVFDEYSIFKHVDQKLKELEGMKEVTGIFIRCTDFSDQGMKSIPSFPRLKKLGIIGAAPSDDGFAYLTNNPSLETIYLSIYPPLTNKGLEILKTIPNLKTLALSPCATETQFVKNLKELKQIKNLQIGGIGITKQVIQELQKALPNAKIEWLNDRHDLGDVMEEEYSE